MGFSYQQGLITITIVGESFTLLNFPLQCHLHQILFHWPSLCLQTNLEISGETDFSKLLQQEEEYVEKMCSDIIAAKPDLVITEKGLSGESFAWQHNSRTW